MNKIKEALEAGKAIHCKTEDEARRLFEVMGWCWRQDANYEGYYYWASDVWGDGWDVATSLVDVPHKHKVVEFSTLVRSTASVRLSVDDEQAFMFRSEPFRIEGGIVMRTDQCGQRAPQQVLWAMLEHPEEIHPCPVWSEESIQAARAAELLGFAQVFRRFEEGGVVMVSETGFTGCLAREFFPEIQPGQTVQLSEIK